MSVTLIAEKAGVSIATVSRVLNNSRSVRPEIAAQVRKAVEELNLPLRPSRRRRRGKGGETASTIAIVSLGQPHRGWFDVPVIASVVAEISRAAQNLHMDVLITEMPNSRELSPVLKRPGVDGALLFINSAVAHESVIELSKVLPVVRVMGGQLAPAEIDHVGPDNNAVGYLAGEYLLAQGATDLAYLTLTPRWEIAWLRAQGFLAAADARNLLPQVYIGADADTSVIRYLPNPIVHPDLNTLIARLKSHNHGKLGLFVSRDEETVAVYRALSQHGLEPGRDLIVVSCDNEQVRLSTLHPQPASIDLGAAEIANRAVRRLATRIKRREEPPVRILVTPHLAVPEPIER